MMFLVAVGTEMIAPEIYGPFATLAEATDFASTFKYDTEILTFADLSQDWLPQRNSQFRPG